MAKSSLGRQAKHKITLTTEDLTSKAFIYSMQKTEELNFLGNGHPEAIKLDLGDEYDTSRPECSVRSKCRNLFSQPVV